MSSSIGKEGERERGREGERSLLEFLFYKKLSVGDI
jgi:hypothetical protein